MSRTVLSVYIFKVANVCLALAWSLGVTFILIRTIGVQGYAFAAGLLSLATLLLISDLGLSAVVYSRIRSRFLGPRGHKKRAAPELAIAISVAVLVFIVGAVLFVSIAPSVMPVGESLFVWGSFFASMLSVAWILPLMRSCAAVERMLLSESIECGRRALVLCACVAMYYGMPLGAYAIAALVCNIGAAIFLIAVCRRGVDIGAGYSVLKRRIIGAFSLFRPFQIGSSSTWVWSGLFAISEFLIYNIPYFVLGIGNYSAASVVAFDTFFKVTRFGAMSYSIGGDAILPMATRAFGVGSRQQFVKSLMLMACVNAVPSIIGAMLIVFFGFELFGFLLNDPLIVSEAMRLIIAAMLIVMSVQSTSGIVLIGLGCFRQCAFRASAILIVMGTFAILVFLLRPALEIVMLGYVVIFAGGAASYFSLLVSTVSRMPKASIMGPSVL